MSTAITEWARQYGIRLDSIQPGEPQHNAHVERFNRSVRYEWLSLYHWKDLDHVQRFATDWMWADHHGRPNMVMDRATSPITHQTHARHRLQGRGLPPRKQHVDTIAALPPACAITWGRQAVVDRRRI
ncbi:integrase core domain-containing protein [Mycetohabitans sp. B4]|uniref:integrase core domain-containing protein n=1 Tax=Mycetohabitans TaxID=2571159 RepID=UPI00351CE6EB